MRSPAIFRWWLRFPFWSTGRIEFFILAPPCPPKRIEGGFLLTNSAVSPYQRNRYDSFLIWLYVHRKDSLVPDHIKQLIPHSTASTWRNLDCSSFIGHELRDVQQEAIRQYEILQKHPLQLTGDEVKKIKALFVEPAFACWPAVSLYYEGLRNHGLFISLSTFYKYVNLLGLKRKWKKRQSNKNGLKAFFPNQYLHVDTTIWKMDNGTKAFIALVSDNFSKMILGWSICLQNKALNVKQALDLAVKSIHQYHPNQVCTTLVADGGSENYAVVIDELLRQTDRPEITKVIALKDIRFSNSLVEAVNKIMKRYLRHHIAHEYDQLEMLLLSIIKDYNETRPHGSLHGLTPMEAYKNPSKSLSFKEQFQQAKSLRIAHAQGIHSGNQPETCSLIGMNC